MPARIRLQRFGKKGHPVYHIVVADGRAPRDGKFIEKLGTYNPMTNPATIDINIENSVKWLTNGAQPSDTCRAILSYKGILYKHHLLGGVAKGALTLEQAEAKFAAWVSEKEAKITSKISKKVLDAKSDRATRLEAETKAKDEKAKAIAAKNAEAVAPQVEEAPEAPVEETPEAEA